MISKKQINQDRVQLVNPWSGAIPPDKNLTWAKIRAWAKDNVHTRYYADWIKDARLAFIDRDGAELVKMIIGS